MTSYAPKRFLFATWEGGGSVSPVLTVVRKLVQRGHHVRVMSDACNRPECDAAGAEFIAWTRAPSRPDRSRHSDIMEDWKAENPADGIKRVMDTIWTGPALGYAQDVIEEIGRAPCDLVVASEMLFGVAAGCEAIGQPFVQLAVNISLFPLPGVPPIGGGLLPARTDDERAMHDAIIAGLIDLCDQNLPPLNAARAVLGLKPLDHLLDQNKASRALLLATSPAFDFAPDSLPRDVHYVGPQLDEPAWAEPLPEDLRGDAAHPLVAVAFSTTFQNHAGVLQRIVDALAGLPVRGLVTLGAGLEPGDIDGADNVIVVESAQHDRLMREAAIVVTHGGHGTVTRALSHHCALLVIPHGRDQNDNAVRVTARGAGLSLDSSASVAEIRHGLRQLLGDPAFAAAAARLGKAVARDAQSPRVIELLEAHAGYENARPDLALCA